MSYKGRPPLPAQRNQIPLGRADFEFDGAEPALLVGQVGTHFATSFASALSASRLGW